MIETFRELATREESLTAARVAVFLPALVAGALWARSKPRLALGVLTLGGLMGLSYWLLQIALPFGLGSNASLTRQWAQAGVNALAGDPASSFVAGLAAEPSLPALLARLGLPLNLVHAAPQMVVLWSLIVLALVPHSWSRNRTTADFTGCLLLAGGLWPGSSCYDWALQNPLGTLALSLAALLISPRALGGRLGVRLRRARLPLAGVMIFAGTLFQSPVWLLLATGLIAGPLRIAIRKLSGSAVIRRRVESFAILAVFGGGPVWWNPARTVPGFLEATDPGTAMQRPLNWIRDNVAAGDVVLASPAYSAPVAALAGRRVLFPPVEDPGHDTSLPEPTRRERLYASTLRGEPVARLAEHFSATHLFLGPGEPTPISGTSAVADGEPRLALVLVYQDVKDFRVFRLTKK